MNKLWTNLKSWYGVLFLVLLAGGVLWSVLNGLPHINNLRAKWEAQRLQNQWEKPYREDKYGGKTPEETYDMFLDALRKGDTTLASKYFTIGDQEKWMRTLSKFKENGSLVAFAQERENLKSLWKKSNKSTETSVSFTYQVLIEKDGTAFFEGQEINIPAGNYQNESVFTKYPSGVWKIEGL